MKTGGHFLSLLSVHQEQVELGWPGVRGVKTLPVLDDSGGGGLGAEPAPSSLGPGQSPPWSSKGDSTYQMEATVEQATPPRGTACLSSGYPLVLSWLSSAGGSGKHPFSHDSGASLLWDWLSQCE